MSFLSIMANDITILLADDHPIFRHGLRQLIESQSGLRVVDEAADGLRAVDLIQKHKPDIAIVDLDMPELDGFGVARRMRELGLPTKIVILTMHNDERHLRKAIDLEVLGYVIKDSALTEIFDCLKMVAKGANYISPVLSSFLVQRSRRMGSGGGAGLEELTPTERRVLKLLADLKTTKEIASELGVSPRTIDSHRANICSKLDLQGSHALVKYAIQHKDELI